MNRDYSRIGETADYDDIAPKGTKITQKHIDDHHNAMDAAHAKIGRHTDGSNSTN